MQARWGPFAERAHILRLRKALDPSFPFWQREERLCNFVMIFMGYQGQLASEDNGCDTRNATINIAVGMQVLNGSGEGFCGACKACTAVGPAANGAHPSYVPPRPRAGSNWCETKQDR